MNREQMLEDALKSVATFSPNASDPTHEYCWCDEEEMPTRHFPFCVAARSALAASPSETAPGVDPRVHYRMGIIAARTAAARATNWDDLIKRLDDLISASYPRHSPPSAGEES